MLPANTQVKEAGKMDKEAREALEKMASMLEAVRLDSGIVIQSARCAIEKNDLGVMDSLSTMALVDRVFMSAARASVEACGIARAMLDESGNSREAIDEEIDRLNGEAE
jgi:hypothetical protein